MTTIAGLGVSIPDDWGLTTLGRVTSKIGSGATPRGGASVYIDEGPVFIRSQNVYDSHFKTEGLVHLSDDAADALRGVAVVAGDVLINITGDSILRTCLVPPQVLPARVNQHVAIVRSNGRVVPGFLQKWLSLPAMKEFMIGHSSGGTRKAITKGHLQSFPIPAPSIAEQRRIAAVFDVLDDKIESNRRATDLALRLARALVDAVTSDRELVPYAESLRVRMGSAFRGTQFTEPGEGRPLLRIRDLKTFEPQIWTREVRSDEVLIRPGDIVVGMDAEFRATLWLGDESVLNQRVCSFEGRPGVGRAFVLAALEPELAREGAAKTGTTVIHLNKSDIETFEVPDLREEEHRALAATTEPLINLAVARSLETQELTRLRDTLLPVLLSGRIRVPEEQEAVA